MSLSDALGLLACPSCGSDLRQVERTLRCPSGHSFDIARQGYVNLTSGSEPANADTAAMLAARGRVHAAGVFAPLSEVLALLLHGRRLILEAGSGTAAHLRSAMGQDPEAVGIALDISKAAARIAARADPRIAAVVADVWSRLPLAPGRLDAVLCAFAPRNLPEFHRVLRGDGRLVVVTPRSDHLAGLRDEYPLLRIPAGKAEDVAAAAAEYFTAVDTRVVRRRIDASADLAQDLVAMGPNAFHRLPTVMAPTRVTIDLTVQVFGPLPG